MWGRGRVGCGREGDDLLRDDVFGIGTLFEAIEREQAERGNL